MAKFKVEFPNGYQNKNGFDYAFEGAWEGPHGYVAIYSKSAEMDFEAKVAYEVWLVGTIGVRVPKDDEFGNTAWTYVSRLDALKKVKDLGFDIDAEYEEKEYKEGEQSYKPQMVTTPRERKRKAATETAPREVKPKAPKADCKISFKELTVLVLQDKAAPLQEHVKFLGIVAAMTVDEIWSDAEKQGLVAKLGTNGATPKATLSAFLGVQSKKPEGFVSSNGGRPVRYALRGKA